MGWRLTDLFSTSDSSSSATSRSQQTASNVSSSPSAAYVSSTPSAVPSAAAPAVPGGAVPAPTSRAASGATSQAAGEYFWGIFFAIGAVLQFVYAIAVVDRIAYTLLVVRRALGLAQGFPLLILFAPSPHPRLLPPRFLPLLPLPPPLPPIPTRIAYTMLVVRRALGFARGFPLLILFAHVAALLLATWMGVWTFGVSGIMAQDQAKLERWWISTGEAS
ncbi:unnamed protein product [Closterium sp. NIES-64]|nr:unnamed protein product [Closterium sp. NIES-64]